LYGLDFGAHARQDRVKIRDGREISECVFGVWELRNVPGILGTFSGISGDVSGFPAITNDFSVFCCFGLYWFERIFRQFMENSAECQAEGREHGMT
jgi:hypothetical protein